MLDISRIGAIAARMRLPGREWPLVTERTAVGSYRDKWICGDVVHVSVFHRVQDVRAFRLLVEPQSCLLRRNTPIVRDILQTAALKRLVRREAGDDAAVGIVVAIDVVVHVHSDTRPDVGVTQPL